MSIYTKKGDHGKSRIIGGNLISKASVVFDVIGDLDELNCYIGISKTSINDKKMILLLDNIQRKIFSISSIIASNDGEKNTEKLLNEEDVLLLEKEIDEWQTQLPQLKNFLLPGGSIASSNLQYSRALCRRVERKIVAYSETNIVDELILKYINRLSDWLYTLSRFLDKDQKTSEEIWKA